MKIGVISDLHIDLNSKMLPPGESYDHLLARLLYREEIDLLLLAGDIASDYRESIRFLDQLHDHRVAKIFFVPGNHDFWSLRNKEEDTCYIYERFKEREDSLVGRPYSLNGEWALVGNPGWYDYGFGSSRYTQEEFARKKLAVGGWNDRLYVHWPRTDQETAALMLEELKDDMQKSGGKKMILMTHVVTHPDFVVPLPHKIYDYYNAFLGSSSYQELYRQFPVVHSVMGHVHFRKNIQEEAVNYYCRCLGNWRHWYTDDPELELAYTLDSFVV